MAKTVKLEIITPTSKFYSGDVNMVIVRTELGDEAFLAGHSWACKLLAIDELRIKEDGASDFKIASLAGGYVDVKDSIMIYTDSAEWQQDIDKERAQADKEWAENLLANAEGLDPDEIAVAEQTVAKSITRLRVANGGRKR